MKAVIQKTDVQTVRRNLRPQPEAALKGEWSRGAVKKNSEIWHGEKKKQPAADVDDERRGAEASEEGTDLRFARRPFPSKQTTSNSLIIDGPD